MNEICPDVGSGGSFLCGVRASVGAAFRAGAGRVGSPGGLCYSALTRRGDISHYRIVNCAPAKGCVWPVLAPARAWVRAGAGRRGWDSECGIGARGCACSAMRFWRDVWRSDYLVIVGLSRRLTFGLPCPCGSVAVFGSAHACCLTLSAKQDGLRYAPFLFRRSRSPFVRSRCVGVVIGLGGFTSGWCVYLRRFRRVTGDAWERGWRRGFCAFLRSHIGAVSLSAGSTLGLNVEAALRPLFGGWSSEKVRFTGVLPSVHACCLTLSAKQDGLRYAPFLFRRSRSPFVRFRGVGVVIGLGWFTSGLCAYLRRSRRGAGDAGTGLAARRLCVFAQPY